MPKLRYAEGSIGGYCEGKGEFSMMDVRELTPRELDALKEVSNIGSGHAATALSQLVHKKIMIETPHLGLLPVAEASQMLEDPEALVIGIYLTVRGSLSANIVLLFPQDDALSLAGMLLGRKPEPTESLSPLYESALKEVGSIVTCSYLNALSQLIHTSSIPSVPGLASDMAGAVVDRALIELGQLSDYAVVIQTEFIEASQRVMGYLMFFPHPSSIEVILEAIGVGK
jgi:chemotaxis protein CheC